MARNKHIEVGPTDLRDQVRALLLPLGLPEADNAKRIPGWCVSAVKDTGSVFVYWVPFGGRHSEVLAAIANLLSVATGPLQAVFGTGVAPADYWIEVSDDDLAPFVAALDRVAQAPTSAHIARAIAAGQGVLL